MKILDGKNLSAVIKDEVLAGASSYKKTPILAVIQIGHNSASDIYVNNKKDIIRCPFFICVKIIL